MLLTRSTPLRRKAASSTSSLPVSEPVWEAAALAAAAVRPGFDDDDRLVERHFARGGEEGAGVADGFHVDDDGLRVLRVVAQVIDQVAPADVHHGADGDEGAEADHFRRLQSRTAVQRAPLWLMKPTDAGARDGGGEGGVQAGERAHDAQAVGPDDADVGRVRASARSWRSSSAPSAPISLKPAEMTMAPCTPCSPHSWMMPGTVDGGGDDDGQVDRLGDVGDRV